MRLLFGSLFCFLLSFSIFADPVSKFEVILRIERGFPDAKDPSSLIGHATQKWAQGAVGPFPDMVWDDSEFLHSTQVVLYHIFEELLTKDADWIRFFVKTKGRFNNGTWQRADPHLRQAYATALAFLATDKLNHEYFLKMSADGNLLALVDSWFRVFHQIIYNERIFENWDLSVIHKIVGVQNYKSELHWILDSLILPEDGMQVFNIEALKAAGESFLSANLELGLIDNEAGLIANAFFRGFPRENEFLQFISSTQTRIASRLKKPGLRKVYQTLFNFYKAELIRKRSLIAAEKEKQKAAAARRLWEEEQGLMLALEFGKAIEIAAGPAEHFKQRRQKLVDAAMELFRKDSVTPWGAILKNSAPSHSVLYIVQRIYEDTQLRSMIESHFVVNSFRDDIMPIKLKIKKEGEPSVETRYPPAKCAAALRLI